MSQYLCILGHQPLLSAAELDAVFSAMSIRYDNAKYIGQNLLFETDADLDGVALMQRLGGLVKMAKKLPQKKSASAAIFEYLLCNNPEGKIHFSVSPKQLGLEIKKHIKNDGRNIRYIEPKNTATILHNNLVEKKGDFTIIGSDVFVTIGIQPLEGFSQRDYGRPGADDVSGMLPPKLARMMINLARVPISATLLDPFCGSGTVLMEAATLGFTHMIGSDISQRAIADSKKNMDWLCSVAQLSPIDCTLHVSDAQQMNTVVKKESIDAIVTEPYLGKPLKGTEAELVLTQQAKNLSELYCDAFATLHTLLKKNGVMVCVIPQFRYTQQWIMLNVVEAIQKIGFSPTELLPGKTSLLYHRPHQHVGRAIWRFVKR